MLVSCVSFKNSKCLNHKKLNNFIKMLSCLFDVFMVLVNEYKKLLISGL